MQAFLTPIAVALVFSLMRWLMPVAASPGARPLTSTERRTYQWWEGAAIVPFFIFVPALTYLWFLLLRGAAHLMMGTDPEALYVIQPANAYWLIPSLFLAIVSSAVPITLLYKALLRERFADYERAVAERVGFDGNRILRPMATLFAAVALGFLVSGVNGVTRFMRDRVVIGNPFSFRARVEPYADVTAVLHRSTLCVPNEKVARIEQYVIQFADGTAWSTTHGMSDLDPDFAARLMRWVAARAKREIREE